MAPLNEERWASISLAEQMANIGSEVGRSLKWLAKDKLSLAEGAHLRALDLIDLTIKFGRCSFTDRGPFLKEICRARDLYNESFLSKDFDNLSYLDKYFAQFALICRRSDRL